MNALEALAGRERLRAVFVTPNRQYPTLVPLASARSVRLLELAARLRFAVIEVGPRLGDSLRGPPARPAAATDTSGGVVHVGTLSKLLSPGLRLGFVHGPIPLIRRMRTIRLGVDRGPRPRQSAPHHLAGTGPPVSPVRPRQARALALRYERAILTG